MGGSVGLLPDRLLELARRGPVDFRVALEKIWLLERRPASRGLAFDSRDSKVRSARAALSLTLRGLERRGLIEKDGHSYWLAAGADEAGPVAPSGVEDRGPDLIAVQLNRLAEVLNLAHSVLSDLRHELGVRARSSEDGRGLAVRGMTAAELEGRLVPGRLIGGPGDV